MGSPEQISMPALGQAGEPCQGCGNPLAADQRYCLNCGTRRGGPRLPYEAYLSKGVANGTAAPPAGAQAADGRANDVSPLGAVLGIALLGGMLLLGVLLGRGGDDNQSAAPVVTVPSSTASSAPDAGGSAETTSNGQIVSDWPEGTDGWTVELGTLPKDRTTSADVESQKQSLTDQGATDVGVLDSDKYASLPPGNWVFYSGVFDAQADANSALKKLGSSFPDALVAEVSTQAAGAGSKGGGKSGGSNDPFGASANGGGGSKDAPVQASTEDLQDLQNVTDPDKIPDEVATPGPAPPDDPTVEPGAGSGAQVIK
jgi:hypothetical protein